MTLIKPISFLSRNQALVIETDFYNLTSPFAQGLTGTAISSGTIVVVSGEPNHPGIIALRDSTTANGGYRIMTELSAFRLQGGEKSVFTFQNRSALATAQFRIGWHDSASATAPIDGAYIDWTSANGIAGRCRNNNVESVTGTSFTPTINTWYTSIIELNAAGTLVTFTIVNDAGAVQWTSTVSANIPTGSGRHTGWGVLATENSTSAAADLMYLDYARMEIKRTLVR